MKPTDVEVFAIRAAGLPDDLRKKLYPELAPHCSACDGTGDVHDATGEWRGVCPTCAVSGEES
ncbi:hypothetical protein I5693_15775 [Burkholderia cenocepacia]|uniref:hypothetical protein n=1 Tax=Burkholderia cepacia complex TaxID=87882 RepID=UPI00158EB2E0|nr:hypothetical protein [Burkholderia cenocepacia]MBJ9669007.1 hypothetical protein [Burkholderia cenocepacia]